MRIPRRSARPPQPLPALAGRGAGAQCRVAPAPAGVRGPQIQVRCSEAALSPCRAGALLSRFGIFTQRASRRPGQGRWGVGAAPGATWTLPADSRRRGGCRLKTMFRGRRRDFRPPRIREANAGTVGSAGGKSAKPNLPGIGRGLAGPRPLSSPSGGKASNGRCSEGWRSAVGSVLRARPPSRPHPLKRAPLRATLFTRGHARPHRV